MEMSWLQWKWLSEPEPIMGNDVRGREKLHSSHVYNAKIAIEHAMALLAQCNMSNEMHVE